MTSLKEQLNKLAVPHIQNALSLDTRRISLLFDAKEAANLDREYLFDLGVNGLEEMINIDGRFEKYEKMLFSRNYIYFDRNLQTKDLNKKIDKLIKKFFIDISPYFLLKPAQKMLEWLVYRFHIHLFNVDDWLMTILAFHKTPMFVRVLTILKLDKPNNKWHWLNLSAKSGVTIPQQVLFNQCQKNPGFFRSVCDLINLYEKHLAKNDYQHFHLVISLITITVLGVLKDENNLNEETVGIVSSTVLHGLSSSMLELRAASLMMLMRLIHVSNLNQVMLKKLALIIIKNLNEDLYTESICCLNKLISKLQMNDNSNNEIFNYWKFEKEDIEKLVEISEKYDILDILKIIKRLHNLNSFDHLLAEVISNKNLEQRLIDGDFKDEKSIKSLSLIEKENLLNLLGSKEKKIVLAILNIDKDLLDLVDISQLTEILLDLTGHFLNINKWYKVIAKAIKLLCLIDNLSYNPKICIFFLSILSNGINTAKLIELNLLILNYSRIVNYDKIKEIKNLLNNEITSYVYSSYMISLTDVTSEMFKDMVDLLITYKWENSSFGFKCYVILNCINLFPSFSTLTSESQHLKIIRIVLNIFSSLKYKESNSINKLNNEDFIVLLFNCNPDNIPLDLPYNFIFSLLQKFANIMDIDLIIDNLLELALNVLDSSLILSETVSIFRKNLEENYLIKVFFDYLIPNSTKKCSFLNNSAIWFQKLICENPSVIYSNTAYMLQFLILLGHPKKFVRKQAFKICKYFKIDALDGVDNNGVLLIIKKIDMHKEEIISDQNYIEKAIENILTTFTEDETNFLLNRVFVELNSNILSDNVIYLTLKIFYSCPLKNFNSQLNIIGENYLKNLERNNHININSIISIIEVVIDLLLRCCKENIDVNLRFLFNVYDAYKQDITNIHLFNIASYLTSKILDHFNTISNIELQRKLVTSLIDSTLVTISNYHDNVFGKLLKQLKFESKHICHELLLDLKEFEEPPIKTKCFNKHHADKVKRVVIILESLQNKHKYADHKEMAQLLFSLLSDLVLIEDADVDYCRLLTLNSLHLVFKAAIKKKVKFTQDILNIEAIMQCMHHSSSPQTQQQIILLLTDLIPIFPEYILHNIVSVFTFMGSIIFQRDDVYTFQTITKTIDVIVESLINRENSDIEDAHKKMLEVLHVFVDMRDHMPSHRCTPLFLHLISKMATPSTLFYLPILMIQNCAKKKLHKSGEIEVMEAQESPLSLMSSCLEFIVGLHNQVSIDDQIESLLMICKFIYQLFNIHKKDKDNNKMEKQYDILDISSLTLPHLRRSILFNLSKLLIMILSSKEFILKVLELSESDIGNTKEKNFENIVQQCVCLLIDISEHQRIIDQKKLKTHENESKFLPQLLKAVTGILEKVNYLLSTNCFIEIINSLMLHQNFKIQLKSLELLASKLQQMDMAKITPNEVDNFLHLLPQLLSCLDVKNGADDIKTIESVKQMALFNIKLFTRILGNNRPMAFLPAFSVATRVLCEGTETNAYLLNSSLLCLAELSATFKTHALPYFQKFMPFFIQISQQEEIYKSELSLICLLSSLIKIISSLAEFISPFTQALILQICKIENKCKITDYIVLQKPIVQDKIKHLSNVIAMQIDSRVFLPKILKALEDILKTEQTAAEFIFVLLKDHLEHLDKEVVESNLKTISKIFYISLDLRILCDKLSLAEIFNIENAMIKSFLSLVVKVSENSFRPLFYKLSDFGSKEKESMLTIYHLMNCLAEKLGSLFHLFSAHLVKNASQLLEENNLKNEKDFKDGEISNCKRNFLLKNILGMLEKCFLYDNKNEFSNSSISLLYMPIIEQLENFCGGNEIYKCRSMTEVIPCIVEMANASRHNSHLQLINYQVCLKTRHDQPLVRFSALRTIEEIVKKLGNSYEAFLPETATFISEALEDDCEEVEKECRKVKKTLESLVGDLTKFF